MVGAIAPQFQIAFMNILFVSHAANRSGAPVSLLALVRWLRSQKGALVRVFSLRSGPLEGDFGVEDDARLRVLRRASFLEALRKRGPRHRVWDGIFEFGQALSGRLGRRKLDAFLRENEIEVIVANSVASGAALRALGPLLKRRKIRVVVWVHEMRSARAQFGGDWEFCRKYGDFFGAASQVVRDELLDEGLPREKVAVVYEMLDFAGLAVEKPIARRELREKLGLGEAAFLAGACGTMEARKGFDWWPQIAALAPDCYFVWLGGDAKNAEIARLQGEKLGARLHFLPPTATPSPFFAGLDVFCLPSREDPFPLVALEAAAQNVPLVCFQNAGGIPELVGEKGGICVGFGDLEAMARALDSLRRDAQFRAQLGQNAARRARELCDVEHSAPRFVELLESLAAR
jgi:glycosyltransferase involved in cell wall biosynthesis